MSDSAQQSRPGLFWSLLAVQLACAGTLFWKILPVFRAIVRHPGQMQNVPASEQAIAVAAVVIAQCCYWYRLSRVAVPDMPDNAVGEHLLLFAGRVSFIFGSALFSVVFFHHVPSIVDGPDMLHRLFRAGLIIAVMFTLFCCALEIERLGRAMGTRDH